ncbi:asparaginase [Robertmurraya andreesenii]|uniref:asparaginase n=1 Tax=Anoxybacillus andreesenii TaxID=1325932 RepID=A0ABT9V2R8_9BACL|nr:asparaginase [Robertmurraya andreesenii]MDQ0155246.1 L-asparaginase [Robertmurraya andreesenii]
MKKKILVIHTGGTISMCEDEATGAVRPSSSNPLTDKTQGLVDFADLIIEEPFNLPSPHITPKEMLDLRELILQKISVNQISGVVITHGTDTLEETAYFLDLTVQTSIPIVVTGAMRSSNEIGSDGLYNLISSIKVAASDEAREKGVLVVLNDEIHTAENVTKTHTSDISTFQSPQYGPIGIVTKRGVIFHHIPLGKEYYDIQDVSKRVVLIKAHAGMDSTLLHAINELPCDGIVIEALGQGNLPPATIPGIQALIQNDIPVVFVSRCFNGIAQDTYAYLGGGKQFKELGVIFSNGLNGQKARLKLLILLAAKRNLKEIEEAFSL